MALSGIGALIKAFAQMFADVNAELRVLMDEADPRTTSRLLDRWERVYGLPLCQDAPTDDDSRRAALAGRVAAQGGQSEPYFIDIVWATIGRVYSRETDPDLVFIERQPYGTPFRVSVNRVGDRLNAVGSVFYWIVHMPTTTPAELRTIVECLVTLYKPAHSIVGFEYDTPVIGVIP